MRALAETAVGLLSRDVEYADVRIVHRRHEGLHVENGAIGQVIDEETEGAALRVLIDGQWGFAASGRLDPVGLDGLVRIATAQARGARGFGSRATLAPAAAPVGRFDTPVAIDPFAVPVEDKLDLLLRASGAMRAAGGAAIRSAEASVDSFRETKVFASTEGALLEQSLTETGGGIMATAVDADDLQRRSFPQSVPRAIRGQRGDFATAGWEHVLSLGLVDEAPRVGEEAAALLTAAPCPSAATTLIVSGTQMAQLVHETAGHPAELDRALGSEASAAGGSFMQPELRGRLRFGSDLVNVTADATLERGLGSFAWDDEGVPSQRTPIIKDGIFVGFLTSRDSAGALGERSSGAARADGWARIPLVRMSNVSLEPGATPLEEIVESTNEGHIFDMNRSLSIDDTRRAFRFGCEIGWDIVRGRRGRMLKNCTFSGQTLDFWNSCDAVADAASWRLYGIPSCNKGEPLQVAHIGHGTVPARFRNVRVGP